MVNRTFSLLFSRFCLLLTVMVAGAAVLVATETVTFTFAPKDGTVYEEHYNKTSITSFKHQKVTSVMSGKSDIHIIKDGENFRFETTVNTVEMTRDGVAAPSVLTDLMKGVTIADMLNAQGAVTAISGDEVLRARIKNTLPEQTAKAILPFYTTEELLKKEQQQSEDDVTRFVGRTVKIGESWIDTGQCVLPNEELIPVYRATRIEGWQTVDGHKLLRVTSKYNTSAEGLAKSIGKKTKDVLASVSKPLLDASDYRVSAKGELLLDPATMMLYAKTQTVNSMIMMKVSANSQQRLPVNFDDLKESHYLYQ